MAFIQVPLTADRYVRLECISQTYIGYNAGTALWEFRVWTYDTLGAGILWSTHASQGAAQAAASALRGDVEVAAELSIEFPTYVSTPQ